MRARGTSPPREAGGLRRRACAWRRGSLAGRRAEAGRPRCRREPGRWRPRRGGPLSCGWGARMRLISWPAYSPRARQRPPDARPPTPTTPCDVYHACMSSPYDSKHDECYGPCYVYSSSRMYVQVILSWYCGVHHVCRVNVLTTISVGKVRVCRSRSMSMSLSESMSISASTTMGMGISVRASI